MPRGREERVGRANNRGPRLESSFPHPSAAHRAKADRPNEIVRVTCRIKPFGFLTPRRIAHYAQVGTSKPLYMTNIAAGSAARRREPPVGGILQRQSLQP